MSPLGEHPSSSPPPSKDSSSGWSSWGRQWRWWPRGPTVASREPEGSGKNSLPFRPRSKSIASELPPEGAINAPMRMTSPLAPNIYHRTHTEAMTSAVEHTMRFQALVQANMARMETQLVDSFASAIADMVPIHELSVRDVDGDSGVVGNHSDRGLEGKLVGSGELPPPACSEEGRLSISSERGLNGGLLSTDIKGRRLHESRAQSLHLTLNARRHSDDAAENVSEGGGGSLSREASYLHFEDRLSIQNPSRLEKPASVHHTMIQSWSGEVRDRVDIVAGWILDRQRTHSACAEALWHFLEDPESGPLAHLYDRLNIPVISLTVLFPLAASLEGSPIPAELSHIVEMSIDICFLLEVVVRFCVIPHRRHFFMDPYNLIDILSGMVLGIRIIAEFKLMKHGDGVPIVLFCYVPILRLLKALRRYRQFHLLLRAFKLAFEALPVLLFCYAVSLLTFAALFFTFERENNNVESLSQAMWLAVVTMTTVGYGDISPLTASGKVVTGALTIANSLYMAVPLGIIGNCFHQVWSDRDRLLLMQTLARRLKQWGYSASDIPKIFQMFDLNGDGSLDFEEFKTMVTTLKLGLSTDRTVQLFNTFDEGRGGMVDDREFVRATFPTAYHQIYNTEAQDRMSITASIKHIVKSRSGNLASIMSVVSDTFSREARELDGRGARVCRLRTESSDGTAVGRWPSAQIRRLGSEVAARVHETAASIGDESSEVTTGGGGVGVGACGDRGDSGGGRGLEVPPEIQTSTGMDLVQGSPPVNLLPEQLEGPEGFGERETFTI